MEAVPNVSLQQLSHYILESWSTIILILEILKKGQLQ